MSNTLDRSGCFGLFTCLYLLSAIHINEPSVHKVLVVATSTAISSHAIQSNNFIICVFSSQHLLWTTKLINHVHNKPTWNIITTAFTQHFRICLVSYIALTDSLCISLEVMGGALDAHVVFIQDRPSWIDFSVPNLKLLSLASHSNEPTSIRGIRSNKPSQSVPFFR